MGKRAKTDTNVADRLIEAALPDVVFDGWTPALLARAAKKKGLDAAQVFPGGVRDAVAHFSDMADRAMLARMKKQKLDALRVRDRVALGVRARLEYLTPWREAMHKTVSFLTLPRQAFFAPRLVWRTADAIWWTAGDQATDYNHYTKRLLLSGVLGSTTLYWLSDESENHEESWAFLERRIDNVLKIGQAFGRRKKA